MKKCLFKNLYTYRVVEITVYFVPLIYERKKKYPKKLHLTSKSFKSATMLLIILFEVSASPIKIHIRTIVSIKSVVFDFI